VFWPFAFGDIFSFAFWPYYDPFWDYGSDFIFASLYWPYGDYASDGPYYRHGDIYTGSRRASVTTAESSADIAETCGGLAPGLSDLPMDRIEKALQPSGGQRASFDNLKAASTNAAEIMKSSCPNEIPITPISRLDAVERRVDAMIQAVQVLRAPLDTFYGSLTDEGRRRLDSLAGQGRNRAGTNFAQLCSQSAGQFTALPTEEIQQTVQPIEQQSAALETLKVASAKAADILNGTCPQQTPATPGARLDAMAKRLDATVQAVNTVRPALQDFYASLNDEQKARFNTMNAQAQHQG
jgi:LTXXQ motif family protein